VPPTRIQLRKQLSEMDVVQTDNGSCYKARTFTAAVAATSAQHRRLPPRRPQWNGKVERFNRTLLDEWAYARTWRSDRSRTLALARWLHRTTITATTPPSAAHPSPASTT
jgi:transposase InsO family protein